MLIPGLVSITYRQLTPEAIIDLALNAGLSAIEWGGDLHVPHGDLVSAKRVGERTRANGLVCGSYGSYYRLGEQALIDGAADRVIETAVALGAPAVRVWAGARGSAETSDTERSRIVEDGRHFVLQAETRGVRVVVEYHASTLTDTAASATRLRDEIGHPALTLGWQPPNRFSDEQRVADLQSVLEAVTDVHVFNWRMKDGKIERRALAEAQDSWRSCLRLLREDGRDHHLMLEFVPEDNPAALEPEAATLLDLMNSA